MGVQSASETKKVENHDMNCVPSISTLYSQKISGIEAFKMEQHPGTGEFAYRYLIHLEGGMAIQLDPGSIEITISSSSRTFTQSPNLRVLDGEVSIIGESIVRPVVLNRQGSVDIDTLKFPWRQVGLLLSSGRILMNLYHCGGGNILHVENWRGVGRHFGTEWNDLNSGERVIFAEG